MRMNLPLPYWGLILVGPFLVVFLVPFFLLSTSYLFGTLIATLNQRSNILALIVKGFGIALVLESR